MNVRLPTHLRVSALIRRVDLAGGSAVVVHKGDRESGGVLVLATERGADARYLERGPGADGSPAILRTGPADGADPAALDEYRARRRRSDPDLWVLEVDIAQAERFVAEPMLDA